MNPTVQSYTLSARNKQRGERQTENTGHVRQPSRATYAAGIEVLQMVAGLYAVVCVPVSMYLGMT